MQAFSCLATLPTSALVIACPATNPWSLSPTRGDTPWSLNPWSLLYDLYSYLMWH
ncbi:hypothetical protein Hanom_Chr02g00105961 [Helianthus anomalus]